MSNHDEMDVEKDRGHGLRAPNKKTKEMELEDRHAVLMAQARTRESRDISSNVIHKYILGATTLTKITSSGPK
jgi:hypothetical protein